MTTATKIEGHYSGEGNRIRMRDPYNKHATADIIAGVVFEDHFMGKALNVVTNWTLLDTSALGDTTPTLKADQPGGVAEIQLDAQNEVQLSGFSMANERPFTLNRGLNFEARVRFTVLPTGAVIFACGLSSDHNVAVDSLVESILFRADGSGVITVETDDNSANETSLVATGITFALNTWYVLRICCDDYSAIRFYIDGAQVAAATTFNMSTTAALQMQPFVRIGKEGAEASVGTAQIDYVKCWQNLS
jgi:hypothetical protein